MYERALVTPCNRFVAAARPAAHRHLTLYLSGLGLVGEQGGIGWQYLLPDWLTLIDCGGGTATLSGKPGNTDVGDHSVSLQAQDIGGLSDTQVFTITVSASETPQHFIYLPLVLREHP